MSTGYGWGDLEIGLMAMVPGIERTSHGNMLLASLRKNRGAMIATLQEQFGDDVDAVLDGVESIVDAELEIRASFRIHTGIAGQPDEPQRMERGLRGAFFIEPREEDEIGADIEDENYDESALRPAGADLAPETNIADDAGYSDAWVREGERNE